MEGLEEVSCSAVARGDPRSSQGCWGSSPFWPCLSQPAYAGLCPALPLPMTSPTGTWWNGGSFMPSSQVISALHLLTDKKFLPFSTLLQCKNLASCLVHSIYNRLSLPLCSAFYRFENSSPFFLSQLFSKQNNLNFLHLFSQSVFSLSSSTPWYITCESRADILQSYQWNQQYWGESTSLTTGSVMLYL